MRVSWFSSGVSSFIATHIERKSIDQILYCHIDDQHSDTLRFLNDCQLAIGKEIEILQSPYECLDNVFKEKEFLNCAKGAVCTKILKQRVRKAWEWDNGFSGFGNKDLTYIWGYDLTEQHRADKIQESFPKFKHCFPLIDRGLTKEDCHGMLKSMGIKRPAMYDLGYRNNNCIGCVKGGMGYWNKIRVDFPDVFKTRSEQERKVGHTCIKGIFLDELDPNRGVFDDEVLEDCGIFCQINNWGD